MVACAEHEAIRIWSPAMAYAFTPEEAGPAIVVAARVMRVISTLDRFESERRGVFDALQEQVVRLSAPSSAGPVKVPPPSPIAQEAEARQARHTADQHVLRADLAQLVVDAHAAGTDEPLAADVEPAEIEPAPQPRLGGELTPMELPSLLLSIEAWNARTVGALAAEFQAALIDLRGLLSGRAEPEARVLLDRTARILERL